MSQTRGIAFCNLLGFPSMIQKTVLGNIQNQSVFKINTTDKSRRFNQYFGAFILGIINFRNT